MHELVIVVSDLYVAQESRGADHPSLVPLPGLDRIVRFAVRDPLHGTWRSWLARWAGADALSAAAPATIAAFGAASVDADSAWVWLASAVHLVAGLSTLHLDHRSLLRLSPSEAEVLASEFNRDFHDSGFHLKPLETGDFLLAGPGPGVGGQPDPATLMGRNVTDAHQPSGAGHKTLRRLGAELEMWLHAHAINDERLRRGELAITGLWFWGGGPARADALPGRGASGTTALAFANDAFVNGLGAVLGSTPRPLPAELNGIFSYPPGERAVVVLELSQMLQSNPSWSFLDAVADADRRFFDPAIEALSTGRLRKLILVASGWSLALRRRDLLRFWRRPRPGLAGLL